MRACTVVVGREEWEEYLLCDAGAELRKGGELEKKVAKIIDGMEEKNVLKTNTNTITRTIIKNTNENKYSKVTVETKTRTKTDAVHVGFHR